MRAGIILLLVLVVMDSAAAQSSYDLKSPDGRIRARIRTAGQLRYDVILRGTALLENATLILDVEHKKLGVDPKVVSAQPRSYDQIVEPVVRHRPRWCCHG